MSENDVGKYWNPAVPGTSPKMAKSSFYVVDFECVSFYHTIPCEKSNIAGIVVNTSHTLHAISGLFVCGDAWCQSNAGDARYGVKRPPELVGQELDQQ